MRIVAIGATSSNGMCRVINQINLTKTVEREKKRGKERKKEHKTATLLLAHENNKSPDGTMRNQRIKIIWSSDVGEDLFESEKHEIVKVIR